MFSNHPAHDMPPILATFVYVGFAAWLFRRDLRQQRNVTAALWIPFLWLAMIGSRFVSEWLGMFGLPLGAVNVEDGSPVDAVVFGVLIASGLYVLSRRQVNLAEVVRNNRWLTVFLVYCFLAILWSDFPFVAFKRWLKVLGHPIMVLVLLTEPDPEEAIIRLFKRCAYFWVPVSILFVKYYPQWGRSFDAWSGAAMNCGICTNKNLLGVELFIVGTFFFWYLLKVRRRERNHERRNELVLITLFLGMIGWLLHMSQSSTSLVSFLIAAAVMGFLSLRSVKPQYIGIYLVSALIIGLVAVKGFDIYTVVLHLLGKNPTLTDRTEVWHDVLQIPINPILGAGFESFWLGDRLQVMWAKWWWHPNEAHNAYLETYLNLGLVGLFLWLGWFVATYCKARRDLLDGLDWGRFRLGFLVAVLFYNWTEAPFKAVDPVYFVFFLIAMDYPKSQLATANQPMEADDAEAGVELISAQARSPLAYHESACNNLSHY
jgi:exopolysaccharide production protein ExoQ